MKMLFKIRGIIHYMFYGLPFDHRHDFPIIVRDKAFEYCPSSYLIIYIWNCNLQAKKGPIGMKKRKKRKYDTFNTRDIN